MKIKLTCSDNRKYESHTHVYVLWFDPVKRVFRVPYMDWDFFTDTACPLAAIPNRFVFSHELEVCFDKETEAEAFKEWLVEAEKLAQEKNST